MARLIYSAIASLDGYIADADGVFDWAAPDEEVHSFLNDLDRPIGTYLLGRRMYEVLLAWETMPTDGATAAIRDFAGLWRSADKIVYSRTLDTVSSARTRIERDFDIDEVHRLKQDTDRDISVGGPTLAESALRAGLVDEVQLYLNPIVVGNGLAALPTGIRFGLELLDEHRFAGGVVFLRYSCSNP